MVQFGIAQLRIGLRVKALVAVSHVDGQHPADVGVVDGHALGGVPVTVLAEQIDLVPKRASARTRLAL